MSTITTPNEEAAGLLVVNLFKLFFFLVGSIFRGIRNTRTIITWLLVLMLAFKIGTAVGILALVVMVGVIILATTNLLNKIPALAQHTAKVREIANHIAPGVAEYHRMKSASDETKAFIAGNQLLTNLGVVNEGAPFGILSYDEDGDTVVYLSRKKKHGRDKLQEITGGLAAVARILEESKAALGAAYIDVDPEFKDKLRVGKIFVKSTAGMDPAFARGNAVLRMAGIVTEADTNFYNVRLYVDGSGQNIEIAEPIGNLDAEDVVAKLIKARKRFGASYATSAIKTEDNWIEVILITDVPRNLDEANDLLRETGLVSENDATLYDVLLNKSDDQVVFQVKKTIRGRTSNDIIKAVGGYAERFDARTVRSQDLGSGLVEVVFVIKDFLDEAKVIDYVPTLDENNMSVVCATDAFGNATTVAFKETPGMIIAGIPGSGKTAGATSFLAPIAMSPDVEVSIIDGKGGSDWDAYRPLAKNFIQGAENLEEIADLLEDYVTEMNRRLKEQKEVLGVSNFWAASPEARRKAGLKFRLMIIDECQDLFSNGSSAEERKLYARIERAASQIVRKGRSAGTTAVFITQKTTADAIPSGIRDNCALRISFRVLTVAAKIAILGEVSEDPNAPDPTKIPANRKGGAVMATDTGEFTEVRFYYIPEPKLEQLINEHAAIEGRKNKIATVIHMLAQADSSAYPDEAATARDGAYKMMARYGITEDDLFRN